MCDYSMGVAMDGYNKGIQQGVQQGISDGQELLIKAIKMIKDGKSDNDIRQAGVDDNTISLAKSLEI